MLSPQDIKNKTFTRSVRGYNVDEVDKYIDFYFSNKKTAINPDTKRKYKKLFDQFDLIVFKRYVLWKPNENM